MGQQTVSIRKLARPKHIRKSFETYAASWKTILADNGYQFSQGVMPHSMC